MVVSLTALNCLLSEKSFLMHLRELNDPIDQRERFEEQEKRTGTRK